MIPIFLSAVREGFLITFKKMRFAKLLFALFSFAFADEYHVEINGTASAENFQNGVLRKFNVAVAGFSYCPLAKGSIRRLREIGADYAVFFLDEQEDSIGNWWNTMASLSGGQGTINIFINGTAVYSNELAYGAVNDEQLQDAIGMQ